MHNAKHSSSRSDQEHLEVSEPTQQNTTSGKCMILVVPRDSLGPSGRDWGSLSEGHPPNKKFPQSRDYLCSANRLGLPWCGLSLAGDPGSPSPGERYLVIYPK